MAPLLTKNFALLKKEIRKHVEEDKVAQGGYWNGESGCFIGCLSHGEDTLVIEQTYGLPVMVQRIAESIFEGLPAQESVAFFAALPEVVACDGKDLSRVGWQFMAAELRSLLAQSDDIQADIQAVIVPIIAGLDLLANDTEWAATAAARAASAADSASWDAAWPDSAAWSAARAATAAARAASAADSASWDAAWSDSAAWSAARAAVCAAACAADIVAARRRQRDLLLQLIKDAPVVK